MKYINSSFVALFFLVLVTGCSKDFLEEAPTDLISSDQLAEASRQDPGLLNGNIAGLYTAMYNTGTGGTTGHDDFGQKGYDIYMDMLCSDMVLAASSYGWYAGVVRYQATTNYTLNADYIPWRYYYREIFGANSVIDALGGNDATLETDEAKHIMGQAKAMRAYGYFYLSQLYAKEYGDGSVKILPIYTDTKSPNQPKSSAKDVYDLIVKDLNDAIEDLSDFSRTTKDQIDATVAKGLLSYALAYRGTAEDLKKVVTLTQEIMNNPKYPLTDSLEVVARFDANGRVTNSQSGFNKISTPSWIWGVDLTLSSDLDLVSWWGQIDLFTYSYAWAGDPKVIDDKLYGEIRDDDIRKSQFVFGKFQGETFEGEPINKFFDPGREIGGQRSVVTDYLYMRSDEFYLLNAEAHARLGEDASAKVSLKKLLDQRIHDDSYVDNLSGQTLKDEIYLQTRIELWGEGKTYMALKRNKQKFTRGTNHLYFAGKSFKYDDPELTFLIPQSEVLNNPQLNN